MKESQDEARETVEKSDLDLVLEFKQGREQAFDELIRRHMEKAMQMAYVILGNYEDAKDVSQEAFVKAYRSLRLFRMQAKFSTWFYRILMNAAKDFLRKKNWKRFLSWDNRDAMENFFERIADPQASPGRELLGQEMDRKISQAVARLPFRQQCVFVLRFLEGLSLREIGEATGLAEGSVKATLHFAVQKFKRDLFPYMSEGGVGHAI